MNLFSCNSPYSLNCHVGAMLVFLMLCIITQSSDAHRTESVTAMDHEQTMGVNSKVLDQKQQTYLSVSRCSGARNCQVTPNSWTKVTTIGWFKETGEHSSARYAGAAWCRLLYTRTHTLYSILCWTGSQCSRSRTSVLPFSTALPPTSIRHLFTYSFNMNFVQYYTVKYDKKNKIEKVR